MTVTYSLESSTSGLATFLKLLFRWKGSIYKLMWKEVVIFLGLYFAISLVYRVLLNDNQREQFEDMVLYFYQYTSYIPLTFLLGFFVSLVIGRWWEIFANLPWPDSFLMLVAAYLPGNDEETRILRRTMARLVNLEVVIVLRDISTAIKKRFPTMDHLVIAGFMTEEELKAYEEVNCPHHKLWIPMQWCTMLIQDAVDAGKIKDVRYAIALQQELFKTKGAIGSVFCYDWVSVPLSYTQVVTLAVHSFFLACLLGRQYLDPKDNTDTVKYADFYFPFFTFLQFLFYMGWLKVAETLINPLGEDDDDFEVNYLVDRNFQISYLLVDKNNENRPSLVKDPHWDEELAELPYTAACKSITAEPKIGSAAAIHVPEAQQEPFLLSQNQPTRTATPADPAAKEPKDASTLSIPALRDQFLMNRFLSQPNPQPADGTDTPKSTKSAPQVFLGAANDLLTKQEPPKFGRLIWERQMSQHPSDLSSRAGGLSLPKGALSTVSDMSQSPFSSQRNSFRSSYHSAARVSFSSKLVSVIASNAEDTLGDKETGESAGRLETVVENGKTEAGNHSDVV